MTPDAYLNCLRALHNLAVAVEGARHLPRGTPGFGVCASPIEGIADRLGRLERNVCPAVERAATKETADGEPR